MRWKAVIISEGLVVQKKNSFKGNYIKGTLNCDKNLAAYLEYLGNNSGSWPLLFFLQRRKYMAVISSYFHWKRKSRRWVDAALNLVRERFYKNVVLRNVNYKRMAKLNNTANEQKVVTIKGWLLYSYCSFSLGLRVHLIKWSEICGMFYEGNNIMVWNQE